MNKTPKLRFKEFSGGWKTKKLGDLGDVTKLAGFEFTKHVEYSDTGEIIALRGLNVKNGKLVLNDIKYIDNSDFSKLNRSKLFIDDLLFTYVGTVGETAIIDKNDKYYLAPNVSRIRFDLIKSNSKFMHYNISRSEYFNKIIQPSIATSSQPALSMENIRKLNINVPLVEEQEKIASFFSLIDDKISLQGDKVEALKDYKKGMMQKIFSREFRFKGFNNDWKVSKAKDLFDSISDKNHNGDLEVLSATQDKGIIPRSELDIDIKFEKGNLKSYKKVNKSDFIISLRSFQGGIEHSKYTGLVSPAYTVFNFKEGIDFNHDFFAIIFKRRDFINRLNTLTYGIRDGKAISFKDFSDVKLEYPEIEEQEKIASFFSIIDKKINKEQEKLNSLNEYKRGLLQQMFI